MGSIAMEEYELMKDSKYRVYVSAVDKALKNFEYTSEWADLISALGKLNKVLLNYMKFPVIPRRIKISKRLAQCMHPALPSGVHLKALETYDIIFKCMGTNRLSHELFIYSAGLFPLLGHAAMNVRPSLLTVYETHFVPLGERLRPGLSGFLSGVLPGLEEGSDHFERTTSLLEKVCDGVGPNHFYGCLWDCIAANSGIRLPAISYVLSHFNKRLSMEDQLFIMGTNVDIMVSALCACMQDNSVLVQRSALDLLLVGFPMHNSQLLRTDVIRLVTASLTTILRRDMSLNRRLFAWLLGSEVNISLLSSEHPLVKKSRSADSTSSNNSPYFEMYSRDLLIQAIKITLSQSASQPQDVRPYRLLVSLLDKPDIGPEILDDILYEVFRTLYLACDGGKLASVASTVTHKGSQELLKSANLLFSTLEPCYIWVYMGTLFDKACGTQAAVDTPKISQHVDLKVNTEVKPVGHGPPNLLEVCALAEFLLDAVSLEAYMDTPSEHLPGLFLHIIRKLTEHCDNLSAEDIARSLQLCAKVLSKVQPSVIAVSSLNGKSVSDQIDTTINQVCSPIEHSKSLPDITDKSKKSKANSKSSNKNKKSKFRLRPSGDKNDIIDEISPVVVTVSSSSQENLCEERTFDESAAEVTANGHLNISINSSGKLSPNLSHGSTVQLTDAETSQMGSEADVTSHSVSEESSEALSLPSKQQSLLEQCLKQYKIFYVKFMCNKRIMGCDVDSLFKQLIIHPQETDDERTEKLICILSRCLESSDHSCHFCEDITDLEKYNYSIVSGKNDNTRKIYLCKSNAQEWESPVKVSCNLLVELSTFPTYCLPETPVEEPTGLANFPKWLQVLVVCACYLVDAPALQLTAIATLLELMSLLRSQTHRDEVTDHSDHQGVVSVVMKPLLRPWDVTFLEHHTITVQIVAKALWDQLGQLEPDGQVHCVELLHQLHNLLPGSRVVEDVVGESLCGPISFDQSDYCSSTFEKFSLLWHVGREVEAKGAGCHPVRSFDRCLLKMLDQLQQSESCPLRLQAQTWLLHSLVRGDVARLIDPLLLMLLDPATARVSVLHVSVKERDRPQNLSSTDVPRVYAISSTDGHIIYHVSSTSAPRRGDAFARRVYTMTTLASGGGKCHITDKDSCMKLPDVSQAPSPSSSRNISLFVNPFAASASSNTNSNDSATEEDSTATSHSKTPEASSYPGELPRFGRSWKLKNGRGRNKLGAFGNTSTIAIHKKSKSAEFLQSDILPNGTYRKLGSGSQTSLSCGDEEENSSDSNLSESCEDNTGLMRRWSIGEDVLADFDDSVAENSCLDMEKEVTTSKEIVEQILYEVLDKVVSGFEDKDQDSEEKQRLVNKVPSTTLRVHQLHSHMLLYCAVYDSNRTLYAMTTLRNILLTNSRMFLCATATTGLANVARGSGLIMLLARHRKSVFGRNFHGEMPSGGGEFGAAYRSSMYLEVLLLVCLYFARSYYPNLGEMRLTQEEISGNRKVQLASTELLTIICYELILIVRDSGRGFASYIADLMARCKVQKIALHCILSSVHSMKVHDTNKEDSPLKVNDNPLQRTLTEEIMHFNDPDSEYAENSSRCKFRCSEHSEGFQVQLLRLLLALIMLEHQVNAQKSDNESAAVTNRESTSSVKSTSSSNQLKYHPGLDIPQQSMFLASVLTALRQKHMRHLHHQWTNLIASALPFMGSSLTDVVMSVINQLCSNIENLAQHYGSEENREDLCCLPADYAVTQLEALTLLCHYCLLDSAQQQSHAFSQQMLGAVTSLNVGLPGANPGQVFSNLVHVFMPVPAQQDSTYGKDKPTVVDPHISARRKVLSNMPRIFASVAALWQAIMTGQDWEQKSCVLGSPRIVKHQLLEFLSPISLHHGINFIAAIAIAWQERKQTGPQTGRKAVPVATQSQQVLVYLIAAIRVMPMDTLVQTVHQVVKQPPPIEGFNKDVCIEVSVLELFYCYMQTTSGSQLTESWSSLIGLLRDGLTLSPPAQFLMLAILNEFVQKTPPLSEKKELRDLQDITAKLIESCAQIAGACLEQTTWLRRNMAVKEEELDSMPDGKEKDSSVSTSAAQYSIQAQAVLAELLAPLLDVSYGSQEKERVVTLLTTVMYNITPYLKNHSRRNVPSFFTCSQLLSSLSGYQYTRKAWRKDVFELLLDPNLFQMEAKCLPFWRTVVDNLMTHDTTTFRDLMARVSLAQSGSLSIFSSREQEYEQRAQLLKRLAFVILCSETDQYHKYMPEIQERLAESLRLPQVVPSVQAQVFLCFRVLLLRMSPQHVTSLWPVIVSELVQVFLHIEQELSTDTEQFRRNNSSHIRLLSALDSSWVVNSNNGLHAHGHPHWRQLQLSAAKLLDLALLLPAHHLPQFQMYRWAFVGSSELSDVDNQGLGETARPHDFVPHVKRIAHLMDIKFQTSVEPLTRQPGQLLLTTSTIDTLQDLHPFFTTLSQHRTQPPVTSISQLESAIELDFLEKLPPR